MRYSRFIMIAALVATVVEAAAASGARYTAFSGGEGDTKATLTIRADGSSTLMRETSQPRQQAEMSARAWEQYQAQLNRDSDDSETPPPAKPAEKTEPKPLSDEELEKKLRAAMDAAQENYGLDQGKLEKLEVGPEQVKTITSKNFATLEELMTGSYLVWSQFGMGVENMRLEKDAENHLKVTLTPYKMPKRYASQALAAWKMTKAKVETRLQFPGKVISSGFPEINGNSTGYSIDSTKPETLELATKLGNDPIVIITELGGLKLDQPIESKTLQQTAFRPREKNVSNVPITEGGTGFTAEAASVTTTTSYQFPEAEKRAENSPFAGMGSMDGMVVQAKIFGPKNRTLQSVTELRILKAVDDKGREVKPPADLNGMMMDYGDNYDFSTSRKKAVNSKQVRCQLGLPEPDAKSIEEVTLQAVVQSVGSWKELTIAVADGKTNEVDLAEVLPGAKLLIRKVNLKSSQVAVEGTVKGPDEIQQLDFQLKPEGNAENFQMQPDYNQYGGARAAKGTRKLQLRGYMMMRQGPTAAATEI